ncbi:hypothetical protein TNCV_3498591 [Trichonephila clavipes]|nr:hypothetical protein TNCV_3498591 [Trichonephila clavipes]
MQTVLIGGVPKILCHVSPMVRRRCSKATQGLLAMGLLNLNLCQVQDYEEVRNPTTTAQLLEILVKFGERYSYKKMHGSKNSGNVERRGWNGVGGLIMAKDRGIGEIRKLYIDRVMAEVIIGVITSLVIKEISGSKAGMN